MFWWGRINKSKEKRVVTNVSTSEIDNVLGLYEVAAVWKAKRKTFGNSRLQSFKTNIELWRSRFDKLCTFFQQKVYFLTSGDYLPDCVQVGRE